MKTTKEALSGWGRDEFGPCLKFDGGIEVRLEPLLFDNQWYLAVYKNGDLVAPKVVVKPGKEDDLEQQDQG